MMLYLLIFSASCNVVLAYYHYRLKLQHHKNMNEICRINVYLDSYEKQINRLEKCIEDYKNGGN